MRRSYLVVVTAWLAALTAPVAAQQAPASVKLSGFAEVSYTYSTRSSGDTVIVGRLYDRFQNHFMLNALGVALDQPYDPARWSAGFHAELLFGQNAAVIKSGGFDLGTQGDVPQLFVTLNVPTASGNGVQFKVGRIPTLMGLEAIETGANPNWSEGNQFIYVENFTGLGFSVETKFNRYLDAQLRVINGWDQVHDNNGRKSLMGRVGVYPDSLTSVGILGFWGPEESGNDAANRYGVELLGWRRLGKAAVWLQGDLGREQSNAALPDPARHAVWWALGGWVTYDFASSLSLALRADYLNDENGARTSGFLGFPVNASQRLASATATLNVRAWPGALVRPEVRYDHSSLPAFDGAHGQVTLALSVAFLF